MSSSLRPQFYVTRPSGDFVALIAIDELPSTISIRGIPRTLTHYETQEMVHFGLVEARDQCYAIDGSTSQVFGNGQRKPFLSHNPHRVFGSVFGLPSNPQAVASPSGYPVFQANDMPNLASIPRLSQPLTIASGYASTQISTPPSSPHMTPKMTISSAHRSLPPLTQALTKAEPQTLTKAEPQALARAIPGKKEYCSYWLRHGECDYQQQGCLYKHEMPTDMATLHRLGLREIPRWYRETHNLSANTPTSNTINGLAQSRWASGHMDLPFSSEGANRRDNWRFSFNRPTGARQSSPLSHAKTLSFSPPKKHFTLPAPPSPPRTRPASPGSPTRGSTSGSAKAPPSAPAQTGRQGTRLSQIRDHHVAARNKNSEASSANKASTSALRGDRARGKRPDLVPINHVPNYPALKPAKRTQLVIQEVKDEDQENEKMEDLIE